MEKSAAKVTRLWLAVLLSPASLMLVVEDVSPNRVLVWRYAAIQSFFLFFSFFGKFRTYLQSVESSKRRASRKMVQYGALVPLIWAYTVQWGGSISVAYHFTPSLPFTQTIPSDSRPRDGHYRIEIKNLLYLTFPFSGVLTMYGVLQQGIAWPV